MSSQQTVRHAIVLLNKRAGTATAAGNGVATIADELHRVGIQADIRQVPGKQLVAAAKTAVAESPDVIIAGGGDGTMSAVASALVGNEMPLGVLPLGTLNHFAKDLGIPQTLPEAIAVISQANIGKIDVGEVNGRYFLNNSSLGVYPRIVLDREAQRNRLGLSKWMALLFAVVNAFRRFPLVTVQLAAEQNSDLLKTPLVFVGNNRYQLDLLNVGTRVCLDRGEMSLYIAKVQTRWGLLRLTLRALLGHLEQDRDFEAMCLSNCWVDARRRTLHVALDGEVVKMSPPLHYRILPGALRVCLPQKTDSEPVPEN